MDCYEYLAAVLEKTGFTASKKASKRASVKYSMRPLCKCGLKPAAVNYRKNGRTYYRTRCERCNYQGQDAAGVPAWQRKGYKKKNHCEKCGFASSHSEQFDVYHIDGDLRNCRFRNLKTVCANCQRILQKTGVKWRQGDLTPDF